MSTNPPPLPLWPRLITLATGLVFFGAGVVDRFASGQPGDTTLAYGSLVIIGFGLGFTVDWIRGRKG